ncbi:MAG: putative sulfate exporter family transporter [Deltaproteobacteria bacterium]|nr:putative sulfate exporter family transporter [Deltaproteobacteria bacterium]
MKSSLISSWIPNEKIARCFSVVMAVTVIGLGAVGTVSSPQALILGIVFALLTGNPFSAHTKKVTTWCLCFAVMGLGAGMDIGVVGRQGIASVATTLLFILLTFFLSHLLSRVMKTEGEIAVLLSSGTAICGGSAIAAVASVIGARAENVSVALGCVFILNSVALLIFPPIGHALGMDQSQFGLWSALAIHDTSSVVGASLQYGAVALGVATTTKLVRALWIAPMSFAIGMSRPGTNGWQAIKKQWFILGFLILSCLFTWVAPIQPFAAPITLGAKRLMVITLFLIGSAFTGENFRKVGVRPLIHSVVLWISMTLISITAVKLNWIGN